MIRIVNMRNKIVLNENEVMVKVDRSSVIGNPFYMHNESERNKVCEQYQEWFDKKIDCNPVVVEEMYRLQKLAKSNDIALACWCYPKRCHAEIIKAWLDNHKL